MPLVVERSLKGLLRDAPPFQAPPVEGLLFSRVDQLPQPTVKHVEPVAQHFGLPRVIQDIAIGVGVAGATQPEAVVEQGARVVDREGRSPAILPLVVHEGPLLGDRDPRKTASDARDTEGPTNEWRARTAQRTARLLVTGYLGELNGSAPDPKDGVTLVEQAGKLARAVVEETTEYARLSMLGDSVVPRVVDVPLPSIAGPRSGPVAEDPLSGVDLAPWDPRRHD